MIARRAGAAGALALVALALAGCGGGGDRGVTTIRFWGMGREGEVVSDLARDFERANPDVRVVVQQIPWSAAHEKFLTSHVGGSSPDVSQLGNTWVAEFEALGAIAPLDARVAASRIVVRDDYFPGIWDTNVVDGTTYGIPWYVDTRVLFYRSDLLAAAGYDSVPGSWAGFRDALAALKRTMPAGTDAIFLPANEWTQPAVFGMQAGAKLLADHDTRGAFRSPEFRRGFDFYLSLFRDGYASPMGNQEMSNLYQEFARGSFAMYITGPWNLGEFKSRLPDSLQGAWATAPLPGPDGPASSVSTAGGSSLVVFRATKHPDAAWRFVEYLSSPEAQARFFHLTGSLPARRSAWADSALAADPRARAFRIQLEHVQSMPKVPEAEQISIRLQEQAEAAIRGAQTADQALTQLDNDVDRMLEKRRWLVARGHAAAGGGGGR